MKPSWFWVLLVVCTTSFAADDLGRLFFTAEERLALDAARTAAAMPAPPPPSVSSADINLMPESEPVVPNVAPTTMNGFVTRSTGPATVWVNGAATDTRDVKLPGGPGRAAALRRGALEFTPVDDQPRQRVKPGQTYDPIEARVVEAYEQSTESAP